MRKALNISVLQPGSKKPLKNPGVDGGIIFE